MAALALVAAITYITAAHLLIVLYYRGLKRLTEADLWSFVREPSRAPKKIREFIRYTQDQVQSLTDIEGRFREVEAALVPDFDRRLAFLKIMVVSAPLFGLLGTVLGMLLTFRAIGVGGSSTSEIIAKGISEALVATQTGMMVAIPGLMMVHVAKRWRNELVVFLAQLERVTLRHFRPEFSGMTSLVFRKTESSPVPAASHRDSRNQPPEPEPVPVTPEPALT